MDEMTQKVLILIASALLGAFSHWLKKILRDGMPGSPIDYLVSNPMHTYGMFSATLAACAALGATGVVAGSSLWMCAALGYTTGWTCDSAINKGPGQ